MLEVRATSWLSLFSWGLNVLGTGTITNFIFFQSWSSQCVSSESWKSWCRTRVSSSADVLGKKSDALWTALKTSAGESGLIKIPSSFRIYMLPPVKIPASALDVQTNRNCLVPLLYQLISNVDLLWHTQGLLFSLFLITISLVITESTQKEM